MVRVIFGEFCCFLVFGVKFIISGWVSMFLRPEFGHFFLKLSLCVLYWLIFSIAIRDYFCVFMYQWIER